MIGGGPIENRSSRYLPEPIEDLKHMESIGLLTLVSVSSQLRLLLLRLSERKRRNRITVRSSVSSSPINPSITGVCLLTGASQVTCQAAQGMKVWDCITRQVQVGNKAHQCLAF